MRIHTDTLALSDIDSAALLARVSAEVTTNGSRSRARAFNVTLTGESKRRVNAGTARNVDRFDLPHAATWDQWGVFLAALYQADSERVEEQASWGVTARPMTTPYYTSAENFADRTADRFGAPEDEMTDRGYLLLFKSYGWPEDAHGDHTFRVTAPFTQQCTKCTATQRWNP